MGDVMIGVKNTKNLEGQEKILTARDLWQTRICITQA